ncbi:MAG: hypothetical protein GF372_04550 [Candidatus Marinimicrobia bacterium]|nr:hypothetical protein [Candidatus Neomarinimicrobiota bacterium]
MHIMSTVVFNRFVTIGLILFLLTLVIQCGEKPESPEFIQEFELKNFNTDTFDGRADLIVNALADYAKDLTLEEFKATDNFDGGKYGAYYVMALFETGHVEKAREFAAQQLIGGSAMFREYTTMATYAEYKDQYGEELRQTVKADQLQSNFYRPDRRGKLAGASENHKLMYACAAYLAGQEWPDDYPKEWYQAGYDYLMDWFDEVTDIGFWEQDSPTYLIHQMGPILSVADHAPEGSEMKKRATMVMDWYLASIAGEYLKGFWITATARDYDPVFGVYRSAESSTPIWLYFNDNPNPPYPHVHQKFRHWKAAVHFAVADYRAPGILTRIATERDEPFIHKEYMYRNPMNPREYSYITSEYGIASIMHRSDRIPPDMTRWKVQWVPETYESEPSAFFMKHPKPDEEDWEQWRGASEAEEVLQHEQTLLAVYNIQEDWAPFIDGPVRQEVMTGLDSQDGWYFFHTGSALIATKAVNGLTLTDEVRMGDIVHGTEIEMNVLRSDGRKNGLVVETAGVAEYPATSAEDALQHFKEDILEKTHLDASGIDAENPGLVFVNLAGDTLDIQFGTYRRVNGRDIDFTDWPMLENPWMQQELREGILELKHDGEGRVYNFNNWTVK